jgi:hypothetical protein
MAAPQNSNISKSGSLKLIFALRFIIAAGIAATENNAIEV